ncbi:MAG: xylose isomerase protein, partial [Phycisphaerales bacterium]|nr:xylose isomerase protein [Phycisphaerales bacterium]
PAPAAPATPVDARPRRPLKKAYFLQPTGASLVEQFKTLKDAGFDGLQLNLPDTKMPVDVIAEALKTSGLQLEGTCDAHHWRLHLSDPDASIRKAGLDALMESMRQCKTLGGTSVLLVPGLVDEKVSYDDCYKRSQEEIRKAIPLANELGIKIAVENVWNSFHLSPIEAARYVDELESPMVGWYFDIGNVINFGFPEQWIRILGKRIVKIHVKEFHKERADKEGKWAGFKVELLGGTNKWPLIMKALDDVGYTSPDHWATIEMGGGDANRMKTLSGQLDRILES